MPFTSCPLILLGRRDVLRKMLLFFFQNLNDRGRSNPGTSMCSLCDTTTLGKRETSLHGLRFITKASNYFNSKPEILSQTWTKPGFRNAPERLADRQREREAAAAAIMSWQPRHAWRGRKSACVRVLRHDEFLQILAQH